MSTLADVLRAVTVDVEAAAPQLNELDAAAGDGDLGVTMTTAGRAVAALLPELGAASLADDLQRIGMTLAREAPSTAGTLVATGLLRAAVVSREGGTTASAAFAALLRAATTGIAERGRAEPGSRTMLDALDPASSAAEAAAREGRPLADVVAAAATAADAGARATATMVARHGRAGWLADRAAGHEDAGARLVAIVLDATARALQA